MNKKDNVVMIGMPGSGKSTVGVVLAKMLGFAFLDSDLVIQEREGKILSEIIEDEGNDGFERIEDQVNASIDAHRTVIATGGSAIYGRKSMAHLSEIGVIVYIKLPLEEIDKRLGSFKERGISMKEGQTLKDLYEERCPLYEHYADIIIESQGQSIPETAAQAKGAYQMYVDQVDSQ